MTRTKKAATNKGFSLWLRLLLIVAHQCKTYATGSASLRASHRDGGDTTHESDRHLQINTRIVGGNVVTDVNKHPYFAEWSDQYCGGVLIHDDLVLTAAHCAAENSITREVYFQTLRRTEGGIVRRVTDSVAHPDFDANVNTREYDFLVLKLDSSALVDPSTGGSTGVETIQMNTNRAVPATGDRLVVTGYGAVTDGGSMSNQLRDVQLEAFAADTCRAHYADLFKEDLMFCAGSSPAGKDACQGDSGGPIVDINTNTLVGLVSFGWGCGDELFSGVYSRVSYAASWIDGLKCSVSSYPPERCGMPTVPPTSAPPTMAPAVLGKLQTYFRLDAYAEEFAMKIVHEETNSVLASVRYGDLPYPDITYQRGFPDLEPGIYTLRISDKAKDGNCCEYGGGASWVVDLNTGNDVWRSDGQYGAYIEVDIEIDARGFASVARETPHYQPGSWPELEQSAMRPDNAEQGWPGAMPSQNTNSLAINVQLDDYAMETSFTLRFNASGGWNDIDAWSNTDGGNAGNGELVSLEYSNLSSGWYHFMINDTANDGLCCDFGRGWVTLMGPISSRKGEKSQVWGNTGEFWSSDEIFFFINDEGHVSKLSWSSTDLKESR